MARKNPTPTLERSDAIPPDSRRIFRFGAFELDVAGYALRRGGRQIRLERRPMDLLILLVERRGELVLRADIVERLWGGGVFVDVDMGVNTAVRKIRQVLADAPEAPAFIETVSGKGYRFIAEVEPIQPVAAIPVIQPITLAVLPFENLGGGPDQEYLADGFTEEATTALGQIDPEHLCVIGRTSVLSYKIDTNPSLISLKDADGRFVLANRAVADLYDTTVADLIGQSDGCPGRAADEGGTVCSRDADVLRTGVPRVDESEPMIDRRTGAQRWFETRRVPLVLPDGTQQVLGIGTEITARRATPSSSSRS